MSDPGLSAQLLFHTVVAAGHDADDGGHSLFTCSSCLTMTSSRAYLGVLALTLGAFLAGRHLGKPDSPPTEVGGFTGAPTQKDLECLPFLPDLHSKAPPNADYPLVRRAADELRDYLDGKFVEAKLDGMSAAVVTSAGVVFEKHWGVKRANGTEERDKSEKIDGQSMYRVASVSKMMIAYEGWVLAQKGIINW
jgi:CubicO group peptidase (beta-lactamase class C family)